MDKPPWRSKKLAALFLGGVLVVTLQLLGADAQTVTALAAGVAAGLPALIAGQAWEDRAKAQRGPR